MNNTSQSKAKLPQIPNKRYFTIGEVAFLCAVKPHVLRYWEQEFPQLRPAKRRGNRRYYQREDVVTVRSIRGLLYEEGYTIIGARIQLDQILKQNKQQVHKPVDNDLGYDPAISFVVEPDPAVSYKPDLNSQSVFNPAEFLSHQAMGTKPSPNSQQEYCSLTELEYLAEQLKIEQTNHKQDYVSRLKSYKMTMDEIIYELKDILTELETNRVAVEV